MPPKNKKTQDKVPDGPRFTMKLPVALNEREVAAREHRAIEALTEVKDKKAQISELTKPLRDSINALNSEVELCRKQATDKSEEREVPCVVNKDYKAGEKWTIRIDTRTEVSDTRKPLTPEERQEVFPNVRGTGGKKGRGLRAVPNAEEDGVSEAPAGEEDPTATEAGG